MTRFSESLAELVESSEDAAYDKLGYHHKHVVAPDKLVDVARAFRDSGYILEMITCQDRRADLDKMRLVYTFTNLGELDRHLIHADLDVDQDAATMTGVYRGADWFEREVYDMYGVKFTDHPNLKRILLPEDADFFALRKDFGRMEDAPEAE